jgi:hypothetical protein
LNELERARWLIHFVFEGRHSVEICHLLLKDSATVDVEHKGSAQMTNLIWCSAEVIEQGQEEVFNSVLSSRRQVFFEDLKSPSQRIVEIGLPKEVMALKQSIPSERQPDDI